MGINRARLKQNIASTRRSGGTGFHKWKEGLNRIRIFSVQGHAINRFDVIRGFAEDSEVGQPTEYVEVPYEQQWINNRPRVCLPKDVDCPWRREYWSRQKPDTRERPKVVYSFNALDLDEPEKGIQQMTATPSVWWGTDKNAAKTFYGLSDFIYGYDPSNSQFGEQEGGGAIEGAVGTVAVSSLPALDGFADALLNEEGMDLCLKFVKTTMLALNYTAQGGPIQAILSENCENIPASFREGIKDLLLEPQFYPGFSRDGAHAWGEVEKFMAFVEQHTGKTINRPKIPKDPDQPQTIVREGAVQAPVVGAPSPADGMPAVPAGILQPAAQPVAQTPVQQAVVQGVAAQNAKKLTTKTLVICTDPEDGIKYNAVVNRMLVDNEVEVMMRPEDQENDTARANVQGEWDNHKGGSSPVFKFSGDDVVVA